MEMRARQKGLGSPSGRSESVLPSEKDPFSGGLCADLTLFSGKVPARKQNGEGREKAGGAGAEEARIVAM